MRDERRSVQADLSRRRAGSADYIGIRPSLVQLSVHLPLSKVDQEHHGTL